jgi:hypothetical protein
MGIWWDDGKKKDDLPITRPGKPFTYELERSTMLPMGKSTISTGPFSIANC